MTRNLLSVYKCCQSNNTCAEFSPNCFVVKDIRTGTPLLRGQLRNGIYEWLVAANSNPPSPNAYFSVKTSLQQWHRRLGHPNNKALRQLPILSHCLLLVSIRVCSVTATNPTICLLVVFLVKFSTVTVSLLRCLGSHIESLSRWLSILCNFCETLFEIHLIASHY